LGQVDSRPHLHAYLVRALKRSYAEISIVGLPQENGGTDKQR
jgi:hypothetical protein